MPRLTQLNDKQQATMNTTNNKQEKVKIYCIEIRGPINALMVERNANKPGQYELTLSLDYLIEKQAYYKSKKGLMYDSGQYLRAEGTPFKILSFKVIKPLYYDQKEL